MRGGVLLNGGRFDAGRFASHVAAVAPAVAAAGYDLDELQEIDRDALFAAIGDRASEDLLRLRASTSLTFGRRHVIEPHGFFTIPVVTPRCSPAYYE